MDEAHDRGADPLVVAVILDQAADTVVVHHRDAVGDIDHFGEV